MTGPYREYAGYGNTIEPVAGITALTGYIGGPPQSLDMIAGDVIATLHGAGALLVALWHRHETGRGTYIDLSQAETQTCTIGEVVLGYGMNGTIPARIGNRHAYTAPHECYRCKGDDMWVVIAVSSDDEWQAFCEAIGRPSWTKEARFVAMVGHGGRRRYRYYMCGNARRKGREVCSSPILPKNKIEWFVIDRIKGYVLTDDNLQELVRLTNEELA